MVFVSAGLVGAGPAALQPAAPVAGPPSGPALGGLQPAEAAEQAGGGHELGHPGASPGPSPAKPPAAEPRLGSKDPKPGRAWPAPAGRTAGAGGAHRAPAGACRPDCVHGGGSGGGPGWPALGTLPGPWTVLRTNEPRGQHPTRTELATLQHRTGSPGPPRTIQLPAAAQRRRQHHSPNGDGER